jgi:glycosyltransferase involved in cell wall biosynthesis
VVDTLARRLRILTNNVHTGYAYELARLGHDFYVDGDAWDGTRLRPENWRTINPARERPKFDLVLVNHDWELPKKYATENAPMIFSVLADGSEGIFPEWIEERSRVVTFLGREVANRWKLRNPQKKWVVELGVDVSDFPPCERFDARILTVGSSIAKRWDKGYSTYITVAKFVPLTLVGPDNHGLEGYIGEVSYEHLLRLYSTCQIYFNPGPIVGISMAEAMSAGMPVVTFRTINLCDLIKDGVNGFVVDTVDGAVMRLRELQADPGLRMAIGAAARETAQARFGFARWQRDWEYLFRSVVERREL